MKILIVSIWPIEKKSIGGTERFVKHLASSLKKDGYDIDVLMLSGKKRIIDGIHYYTIPFLQEKVDEYILKDFLDGLSDKILTKFADLFSKFNVGKYDIVHLNSLICYKVFPEKNRVITLHNYPLEFDQEWGNLHYNEMQRIIKSSNNDKNILTSPSSFYAKIHARDFNLKTEIIPHCLDKTHTYTKLNKKEIRKKLNLSNKYTILLPSRIDMEQKRPDLGLKAIALAKNKLPDFQVIFTGADNQYQENINYLKTIAIKNSIDCKFLKSVTMSEVYKISDLVLLPSKWETFGYCAVESLSLKIKTVLTNIPSFREIARGNQFAFISKHSERDIANSIIRAVNTNFLKLNTDKWSKKYSEELWVNNYLKIYHKFKTKHIND